MEHRRRRVVIVDALMFRQWLASDRQNLRQQELGRHKFELTATQVSLLSRHLPLTGINIPTWLITKDIPVMRMYTCRANTIVKQLENINARLQWIKPIAARHLPFFGAGAKSKYLMMMNKYLTDVRFYWNFKKLMKRTNIWKFWFQTLRVVCVDSTILKLWLLR